MTITLTLKADVNNDDVAGKTKNQIDKEYNILIESVIKKFGNTITRLNPPDKTIIDKTDRIEFTGDSDSVMKFFKLCRTK
jgi:hypothetical protein